MNAHKFLKILCEASWRSLSQEQLVFECEFGATGSFNKVPEKRSQRGLPLVVVKWSPNCVLHRVPNGSGGQEGTGPTLW